MLVLGILRESKDIPDTRVPLTPKQCRHILDSYPNVKIFVQPSPTRGFTDTEYKDQGITLQEDLSQCDVLLGVKEVKGSLLIPNKTYFFFSHTKKKQPYNKPLMQALIQQNIRMVDYECLTHEDGQRVLGFGFYAGLVGAHNGIKTYGQKHKLYTLPAAYEIQSFNKLLRSYETIKLPPMKIALTGSGKVAAGLLEIMNHLEVDAIEPQDFLDKEYDYPVYTHLKGASLYRRKDNQQFNRLDFHQHPQDYECLFENYLSDTDLLLNGIYWDEQIDRLFKKESIKNTSCRLSVVADVTCDVGGSVPINLGATTIEDPVYGVSKETLERCAPYLPATESVDVMAVDNLPNELPRDASQYFGSVFEKNVLPALLEGYDNALIRRATICANGKLGPDYEYLADYAY